MAFVMHSGLPQPSSQPLLAPPRLLRLTSDAWLVSATLGLLAFSPQSSLLKNSLGWSSPPRAAVVIAQLLKLGSLLCEAAAIPDVNPGSSPDAKKAAEAIGRIYSFLGGALEGPESDLIRMSLEREGTPCVWVGPIPEGENQAPWMVPAYRAALSSSTSFRPWLFSVPAELHHHQR